MKLLINTSTLKGTGVVQVATSFIKECINFPENEYFVFLSRNVKKNIDVQKFPENFTFYEFDVHSYYSIRELPQVLKMKRLEKKISPDSCFTVFGPAMWTPRAPHLQGYAYPHYVYKDSPIFSLLSVKEKIIIKIKEIVHMFLLKKEGAYFVCETDDVKYRLQSMYRIPNDNVYRVYNTVNNAFVNYQDKSKLCENGVFKLYSLCSPYRHKNLQILNEVIPLLKKSGHKVMFYVTFKQDDYDRIFINEVKDSIIRVDPLDVHECPPFVDGCDALFLPTLLECFSASYPEAMYMGKPILTSDLPFARTICEDAAVYFDPLSAEDIVDKIISLSTSKTLYDVLKNRGHRRLEVFNNAHERTFHYLNICRIISHNNESFK